MANPSKAAVDLKTIVSVKKNSEVALKTAISQAPVIVAVEADKMAFQMYTGGILDSADCGTQVDHMLLAVGYGTQDGTDYYILQNTWGASWGDRGYIKIASNGDGPGICGVQSSGVAVQTD